MKKFVLMTIIFAAGALFNFSAAQKTTNQVVCFQSNMDCSQCEKTLTEHLKFEKGVRDLKVDHASNTIMIEYREGKNSAEGFTKAIEKKGYKAEKITMEKYNQLLKHESKDGHQHGAEIHIERK